MTGSTDAIASASKASKKVATPTMMRALTCHHEVGRRSSLATMSSTDERVPAPSMFPSPGLADARACSYDVESARAANSVWSVPRLRGTDGEGVTVVIVFQCRWAFLDAPSLPLPASGEGIHRVSGASLLQTARSMLQRGYPCGNFRSFAAVSKQMAFR